MAKAITELKKIATDEIYNVLTPGGVDNRTEGTLFNEILTIVESMILLGGSVFQGYINVDSAGPTPGLKGNLAYISSITQPGVYVYKNFGNHSVSATGVSEVPCVVTLYRINGVWNHTIIPTTFNVSNLEELINSAVSNVTNKLNNGLKIATIRANTNYAIMHTADANHKANNAVSIVTSNGTYICAFGSSFVYSDFVNNASCFIKRSVDGGLYWSDPVLMSLPDNYTDQNSNNAGPLLCSTFLNNAERIWIFCYEKWDAGFTTTEANEFLIYRYSDDDGVTWSEKKSLRGLTRQHNVLNIDNKASGLVYSSHWSPTIFGDYILIPVAERYAITGTSRWKPRFIALKYKTNNIYNDLTNLAANTQISQSFDSLLPVGSKETNELAISVVGSTLLMICRCAGTRKQVLAGFINSNNISGIQLQHYPTNNIESFGETSSDYGTPLAILTIPIDWSQSLVLFSNVPTSKVWQSRDRMTVYGKIIKTSENVAEQFTSEDDKIVPLWRANFAKNQLKYSGGCNLTYDSVNQVVVITTCNSPLGIKYTMQNYQDQCVIYQIPMCDLLDKYMLIKGRTDLLI